LRADVRFEAQARQCKTALAWDYTD
jgi:hypothetical protein